MLSALISAFDTLWHPQTWGFPKQCNQMLRYNWYLGLTSFGGMAAHFQTFYRLFVVKLQWIDEQMYHEMFALCQALPGPASPKMLIGVNWLQSGFVAGILSFLVFSLPATIASFGFALGVSKIDSNLPAVASALLSGLNAAIVGVIFLAGVQLSEKAITDRLSKALIFLGATAGMLYNSLWYFPLLMVAGGIIATIWDYQCLQFVGKCLLRCCFPRRQPAGQIVEGAEINNSINLGQINELEQQIPATRTRNSGIETPSEPNIDHQEVETHVIPEGASVKLLSWKAGLAVMIGFLLSFITVMVVRNFVANNLQNRGFELFANLLLAGTTIFGGGPVVIPLLREYIVAEGWVSARDFLIGLAVIQAFPGPNFNFAVYLGTLAVRGTSLNPVIGATIAFVGVYLPGIILLVGMMGVWHTLRNRCWLKSCLRGINAIAIGLVFTAVYRLWRIGFVDASHQQGSTLDRDPWWVVVTATIFFAGYWIDIPAVLLILLGAIMGLIWYSVQA